MTVTVVRATSTSYAGVTMEYNIYLSNSTWSADTSCCEDMDSKVSLFLYKKKGGTMLYSDIAYGRTRVPIAGTSVTHTYAYLSKTNLSAKYGRSVHALLYEGTNQPYISALELNKTKQ